MKVKKILEKPHRFDGEDIDIFWTSPNGVWQIINVEDIRLLSSRKCIGSTGIVYNTKTDYEERYIVYYYCGDSIIFCSDGTPNSGKIMGSEYEDMPEYVYKNIPKYVQTAVARLHRKTYRMFIKYITLLHELFFEYKDAQEYACADPEGYKQSCAARDYFTGKDRENNKFIN